MKEVKVKCRVCGYEGFCEQPENAVPPYYVQNCPQCGELEVIADPIGLTEKDIVQKFGLETAWEICDTIIRVVKSLRAARGVPTGKDARLVQYEVAIKHAMGKEKIPWQAGKFLLDNLNERTIQAILRIKSTDRDKVKVWLL